MNALHTAILEEYPFNTCILPKTLKVTKVYMEDDTEDGSPTWRFVEFKGKWISATVYNDYDGEIIPGDRFSCGFEEFEYNYTAKTKKDFREFQEEFSYFNTVVSESVEY